MAEKLLVEIASLDAEDIFFKQLEQDKIKNLRANAEQAAGDKYREEHKSHCFRCGTPSLVEVKRSGLTVDICVNKNCGAVHLDAGELEAIEKIDLGAIDKIRTAVFGLFK